MNIEQILSKINNASTYTDFKYIIFLIDNYFDNEKLEKLLNECVIDVYDYSCKDIYKFFLTTVFIESLSNIKIKNSNENN